MVLRRSNELFSYKAHHTRQFVTHEVNPGISLNRLSFHIARAGLEMLLGILRLEEQHKDRVVMVLQYAIKNSYSLLYIHVMCLVLRVCTGIFISYIYR